MVIDPQRIPGTTVGIGGKIAHDGPVVFGGDTDKVESPALRNEQSEAHVDSR